MRLLFQWKSTPAPNHVFNAQAIIGMAFGANHRGRNEPPGVSNEATARIIAQLWAKDPVPVIAQREVAEAMTKLRIEIFPSLMISEAENQTHITSHEVLLQAWRYCVDLGIKRVWLVAHPAHTLRCVWVAEKIGFQVEVPDVSSVPYEPNSVQWWTRNRWLYLLWEIRARIGWKIKGYL